MDDDVNELCLAPFRNVMNQATTAMERTGVGEEMNTAAKVLHEAGKYALGRLERPCSRRRESHGSIFITAVRVDEKITALRTQLNEHLSLFHQHMMVDHPYGPQRGRRSAATRAGAAQRSPAIDAAAELADFFRFSVHYANELYNEQPVHNSNGVWNRLEYRPLEGFVYAVSPFNFTAIAGNLVGTPALMGNVVLWKPSDYAIASNWLVYQILLEAGLPKDVIQFIPGNPEEITKTVLAHKEFASLHYTGSTAVFRKLYGAIGQGVGEGRYRSYPRIVGETGGKNFHLVHQSADVHNAAIQTVRGAFEYQGQKCSATSRVYVAKSVWPEFKKVLVEETEKLKQGVPQEHTNFVGPVIHEGSFKKLSSAIDQAKTDKELELVTGGSYDSSKGYFVKPTVYQTTNPTHSFLKTEFFGPIVTAYVYDDAAPDALAKVCELVDTTTEYGLTGSIFAADRTIIREVEERLRNAAGNFYVNCKSTGAVVGQQAFGGARASGTDDKAGSSHIITRFTNIRIIKEEFNATTKVEYPSNEA
ncbi:hypothetical protein NLG97_g3449 [Lecanicillium saksenae]|uniref:Uncharacterized protein n=1 Tax=Lecanicillium saksenae TaxID=468837 RepID=A0ACC1QZY0_9HYPO|nr:hypothetical protein NLG97_g3449 [Lecanicillium saksenae]